MGRPARHEVYLRLDTQIRELWTRLGGRKVLRGLWSMGNAIVPHCRFERWSRRGLDMRERSRVQAPRRT